MAAGLGKRKRRSELERDSSLLPTNESEEKTQQTDFQALLQKHFEAKFGPLDIASSVQRDEASDNNEELETSESDWNGFDSEEEQQDVVQVVEHMTTHNVSGAVRNAELRGFMSAKPPQSQPKAAAPASRQKRASSDDEDEKEKLNLKKDVELQQLLRESHLLDRSQGSALDPTGKNRHKALDMRLQVLGSKQSVYKIEKMPLSHRKGMVAKAKEREDSRRRQAKENGIVLERPELKRKMQGKRERGVGGPGIGKMRGATLSLSKSDIRGIVGAKSSRGRGKKR